MKTALSFVAAISLAGISQLSHAQHGQLNLNSTDVGHGGAGVYFAGSVLLQFAPDSTQTFGTPFDAYCTVLNVDAYIGSTWGATQLDTTQFVPSPDTSVIGSAQWQQAGSEIAWVANTYGITTDAEQAAATQLAIWDIAEGGNGTANDRFFDPTIGEIKSWSFTDNTILDAQAFAAGAVAAYADGARATDVWFQADTVVNQNGSITHVSQDFVTPGATPGATPEPLTLGLGVAGIGMAIRRRTRKA